ncbi:MAG: hypothetical protein KA419_11760 [Acidobacteria bacterium]|nr:hypothetical protein [Acidobacteriota bacterium]
MARSLPVTAVSWLSHTLPRQGRTNSFPSATSFSRQARTTLRRTSRWGGRTTYPRKSQPFETRGQHPAPGVQRQPPLPDGPFRGVREEDGLK